MALAANRDEQLIRAPDVTETALSPPQSLGMRWSKLPTPGSDSFVGHRDAKLGDMILGITSAQGEPVVEPNGTADDFARKPVASIQRSLWSIVTDRR